MPSTEFEHTIFTSGGRTRSVYRTGHGPKVILMHELPGLSPITLDLGRRIAALGYTVLIPLLFGSLGQEAGLVKSFAQVCISREFTLFRKNRTSPVTNWLRDLAADQNDDASVAVIGMCLTGGLVLGVMLEPAVVAGISAEPSLPFALPWSSNERKANLGLDEDDATDLESLGKPLLALRFQHDRICPHERVMRMEQRLGATTIEIAEAPPQKAGHAHAVLTYHHVEEPADHPSHLAFLTALEFLQEHLPPG